MNSRPPRRHGRRPGAPTSGARGRRARRRTTPPPPARPPETRPDTPDLSQEWAEEIKATARGQAPRAAELVRKALDAYAEEEFETAVAAAAEAKALAPRSARVRELLGLCLYRAGGWQQAVQELLAFRRMTGSLEENYVIADAYRALGRPDRALELIGEVPRRQVPPDVWAEVMIVAAGALADKGELEQALMRLSRADLEPRSIEPYHLRLWYVRSDLLERSGRHAEARAGWERIAAEDPDFYDVMERLSAQE